MPFTQAEPTRSTLMDAALRLQLRSVWDRKEDGEPLASQFPAVGSLHIEQALADAIMLLASAFSAGNEALASLTPNIPAIITRLKKRHPGFSDAGYRDVINFGCFLAR